MAKNKTSFAYSFKKDANAKLAQASLESLRPFIPNIDTEKHFDLLPFACDAAVVNKVNLNGHSIKSAEAVNLYKTFVCRSINTEHSRNQVFGVILSSSLTNLENKILTEDEALATDEPFYITLGGIFWPVVNMKACDIIEQTNDKTSPHYMGLASSWEICFSDFDIILMPPNETLIKKGEIITDSVKIEEYSKLFEDNKRTLEDGRVIAKILKDTSALALGIVTNPAASVSGVAVAINDESTANLDIPLKNEDIINLIQKTVKETLAKSKSMTKMMTCPECEAEMEMDDDMEEKDVTCAKCGEVSKSNMWKMKSKAKIIENKSSVLEKPPVNQNIIMKLTSIKDLSDANLKEVTAANIHELVEEDLKKASEDFAKKVLEKESAAKEAAKANADLALAKESLEKDVADLKKQLQVFAEDKEKREKQEKFNDRMGKLDEKYSFSSDEKKVVASQIKDLNGEAFATYEQSAAILFKDKLKIVEPKQSKASLNQDTIDNAIDAAVKDKPVVPATPAKAEPTLKERMSKAFSSDSYEITYKKGR